MNGHDPLRVVVYPHVMEIGGSQMNAIDLAAAVRDLGHQVTVYAEDGPLVDRVHQGGVDRLDQATGPVLDAAQVEALLASTPGGGAHSEGMTPVIDDDGSDENVDSHRSASSSDE